MAMKLLGALLLCCASSATTDSTVRGRPSTKLLHFNNDLTNTDSQISPFHPNKADPFGPSVIRGAVAETQPLGLTTNLLSPGFCWVAWWNSSVSPPVEYDKWFRAQFGAPSVNPGVLSRIFSYVLDGGEILGVFSEAVINAKQRPAVSFRINDFQSCDKAPQDNYGALSPVWYDNRKEKGAVQNPKGFNETCCWEHKCPCTCYDGTASMVLSYGPILEDRTSLMLELIKFYPSLDFEIDLERWPRVFNTDTTNSSMRKEIMARLLSTLRGALSADAQLGLRIPPDMDVLDQIGIDLAELETDPHVKLDYATMGVSFASYLASSSNFKSVRALTSLPMLFEVTNLVEQRKYGNSTSYQLMTAEMITTVVHDAYTLGADGIATFNFEYYRTMHLEPLYDTLSKVKDESWVGSRPQHWFWLARHDSSMTGGGQLPISLHEGLNESCKVTIAPPTNGSYNGIGKLRLRSSHDSWPTAVGIAKVFVNGTELQANANTSAIFPTNIPDIELGHYAAFDVPDDIFLGGIYEIKVNCASSACDSVVVDYIDLMLPVESTLNNDY